MPLRTVTIETAYQLAGFAAAALTVWMGIRAGFSGIANLGAGFFAVLLYLRFYHLCWAWLPGYLFFLIIGLVSIGLLTLFRKMRLRLAEAARL